MCVLVRWGWVCKSSFPGTFQVQDRNVPSHVVYCLTVEHPGYWYTAHKGYYLSIFSPCGGVGETGRFPVSPSTIWPASFSFLFWLSPNTNIILLLFWCSKVSIIYGHTPFSFSDTGAGIQPGQCILNAIYESAVTHGIAGMSPTPAYGSGLTQD